ncbi:MAG: DNA (cytosine-5-)-methyltransferase [Flavobacteriales bacterium]|nr:DNA (cytosine-5-)-methyltransferase [Flavobacteriales bacterium]|tara:strand:- start:8083 stop:9195 length:1113 start_codon:yes stop_codon:yes gene_type:complete
MKREIRFIDLFAGIGGFHQAIHSINGKCVFASEMDKFARQTYFENYKSTSPEIFKDGYFNEDITDPNLDYKDIPNFDILCAGFPCQPFSNAGHKKGFADTRGTLFFNIQEIVRTKIDEASKGKGDIPKVLILENVKGFKNHDKGRTYSTIKNCLEDLGYTVKAEVLNSKFFGVPQNRERIFIIAWYSDKIPVKKESFNFPYGLDKKGKPILEKEKLKTTALKTKLEDILLSDEELDKREREEKKSYTISERLWEGHQRRKEQHKTKGNGFGYSLFNKDSEYTSTISARYYKDGSEILIDQTHLNKRPRKLHPIEAARLQGYNALKNNKSALFEIPVSNNQAYKQFGNSVSVPVVTSIAKEVKKQLLDLEL